MIENFGKLIILATVIHICAAALPGQVREPDQPTTTGAISGSIVSTAGDLPANTTVYLLPLGASVQPQTTGVKADGTFRIENLEIGVYRVWAAAPGYVNALSRPSPEARGIYRTGDSVEIAIQKGGVITGRVTGPNNAPVVATNVRAFRVKDENGKPLETSTGSVERLTDDRGIYRMYSLMPGTYVVSAGGMSRMFGFPGPLGSSWEVPTYAPSSTRDTAMEVTVRSGDETMVDIQIRGDAGHAISGTVAGLPDGNMTSSATITLADVKSRAVLVTSNASPYMNYAFAFYGLPDGEYELVAQHLSQQRDSRSSEPKSIKVQGADISGVTLTLTSLPEISGRVVQDGSSPADCVKRRATALKETFLTVIRQKQAARPRDRDQSSASDAVPLTSLQQISDAAPDSKGDFAFRNLRPGTFHLSVQLPGPAWYVRAVTLGPQPKGPDYRVISDGISVKQQSISGLTVTMSEGAAAVRGQLTVSEGQRLPGRVFVYLVPAEKEDAANLLRYFETPVENGGRFYARNVPPGDYLLVGLKADGERPPGNLVRQDSSLRASVVREAQKSKQSVSLKPCERLDNYELPITTNTKP